MIIYKFHEYLNENPPITTNRKTIGLTKSMLFQKETLQLEGRGDLFALTT